MFPICTLSSGEDKEALNEDDEYFVPSAVEDFCKKVYTDDEHFIFFARDSA